MSRIAKKVIAIPEKVTVEVKDRMLLIKGPLGEIHFGLDTSRIAVEQSAEGIQLIPKNDELLTEALWGTYASILKNHLKGVTEGFTKKLVVEGIGYKSDVRGEELVLSVGFSHQVHMKIPKELKVVMEKMTVVISGIDKELVGKFAASVRAVKKPEPYKGKGIRYEDEVVRRKQGKKSV